jgi:WD40 repeat protein
MVAEFQPHDYAVTAIVANSGPVIYTGSTDGSIKMWNRDDYSSLGQLFNHGDCVNRLVVQGDYLISGGQDAVVFHIIVHLSFNYIILSMFI